MIEAYFIMHDFKVKDFFKRSQAALMRHQALKPKQEHVFRRPNLPQI